MRLHPFTATPLSARQLSIWWWVYFAAMTLMCSFSITLWFGERFRVLPHNFDMFCGVVTIPGWSRHDVRFLSRFVQTALHLIACLAFLRIGWLGRQALESLPARKWIVWAGALLAVQWVTLPWMNPDLFFPIGRAWVEVGYGLNVFETPILAIEGFARDPMFQNMDAPLFRTVGNYGPLHHELAATIVQISGGNIRWAAFLYKGAILASVAACGFLVYRVARQRDLPAGFLTFIYLTNPFVALALVGWGHNDAFQNLFLLGAIYTACRPRPFLSGIFLGAAISFKFVALVVAPAFFLYWIAARPSRLRDASLWLVGTVAASLLPYLLHEGAFAVLFGVYDVNWSPTRSSIYYWIPDWLFEEGILSGRATKRFLSAVFVLSGAVATFRFLLRRKPDATSLITACVWVFGLYFLIAAPAVLEWYLTWNLALILLLPNTARYVAALAALFPVLVPFTLYLPDDITYLSSALMFLLFAILTLRFYPWKEQWIGAQADPMERHPAPDQPNAI